ncbi:MAG: AAA family ATPase, partial [Bdellovibrionota bacterium]
MTHPDPAPPEGAVSLSQVSPKKTSFLLWPYLPEGRLCVLEGGPGSGKTWLAAQISGHVATGFLGRTADYRLEYERPGKVLFLNPRRDPAEVLLERLRLSKIPLENVLVYGASLASGQKAKGETPAPPDFEKILNLVGKHAPKLLVLDGIEDFLDREAAAGGLEGVKRFSRQLSFLAESVNCAILAIRETPRGKREKNLARAFDKAVSSVLVASQDADDPTRRFLGHLKSVHAPLGKTLVHGWDPEMDRYRWINAVEATAREVQGAPVRSFEYRQAEVFLRETLREGPCSAAAILAAAAGFGIGKKALYRAKDYLRIYSRQMEGYWVWMTEEEYEKAETSHRQRSAWAGRKAPEPAPR